MNPLTIKNGRVSPPFSAFVKGQDPERYIKNFIATFAPYLSHPGRLQASEEILKDLFMSYNAAIIIIHLLQLPAGNDFKTLSPDDTKKALLLPENKVLGMGMMFLISHARNYLKFYDSDMWPFGDGSLIFHSIFTNVTLECPALARVWEWEEDSAGEDRDREEQNKLFGLDRDYAEYGRVQGDHPMEI